MWTLMTIVLVIISGSVSQLCSFWNSVELINRTYNGIIFENNELYVDSQTGVERGCVCLKGTCARKCCPPGLAYDSDNKLCVVYNGTFDPPVVEDFKIKKGFKATENFIFMYGKMKCDPEKREGRYAVFPASDAYNLTTDGKFYMEEFADGHKVTTYGPDKYCIDTFLTQDYGVHLNALICFVAPPDNNNYLMSSSFMLVSCFFILLTVAVYAWLPELRNLQGQVLMAYLICLFVGFVFLATMQIRILTKEMTEKLCLKLTFIIYFSLLAAFFWLNVMCYNIWWTCSGKEVYSKSETTKKRFLRFAAYAFGMPTALTILLAVMEFADLSISSAYLPNMRRQGCFLYGNSKLLYFYGPIIILCVANIIFFALTAFKIWQIKQQMMLRGRDGSTSEQVNRHIHWLGLYVKLFAVMGISWILEVVSSFYPNATLIWNFTDAYNVLVGLVIFIIFVCKKKTRNLIKKKFGSAVRADSEYSMTDLKIPTI